MASRILHAAIAKAITEAGHVRDSGRFLFGSLLPDAYTGAGKHESHLHVILPSGKRTYDLGKFRKTFSEELKTDDLYRGYYLHLIEDLYFRDFVYNTHGWDPRTPGNVARLHRDYTMINSYIIEKYGIKWELTVPEGIRSERICEIYDFDTESLINGFRSDFDEVPNTKYFFFTPEMADEYIALATDASVKELIAIDRGGDLTDTNELTWG